MLPLCSGASHSANLDSCAEDCLVVLHFLISLWVPLPLLGFLPTLQDLHSVLHSTRLAERLGEIENWASEVHAVRRTRTSSLGMGSNYQLMSPIQNLPLLLSRPNYLSPMAQVMQRAVWFKAVFIAWGTHIFLIVPLPFPKLIWHFSLLFVFRFRITWENMTITTTYRILYTHFFL